MKRWSPRIVADGSRDAAHGALIAGFLFLVLLTSAGSAMGLDGGSSSGGGTISQRVNLWYDAGNDATSYDAASSAANYKINITYTNAGASSPTATQWALVGGNI